MTSKKRSREEKEVKLEVVLKCDSAGTEEAVISGLKTLQTGSVPIEVIHTGIGPINKTDIFMALTGSRLVIGFEVGVLPKIEMLSKEKGVEVRIYETIIRLREDLQKITAGLIPEEAGEKITGRAKVIALFKSRRKGIILGCAVLDGSLAVGKNFRVVSAPGTVYSGKIESLHIEKEAVHQAKPGQQAGVKISDFKGGKVGDLVECFERTRPKESARWNPRGGVLFL